MTALDELIAGPGGIAVTGALAAAGALALGLRRRALAGTTLVAPWCWSLAVLAALALAEVTIALAGEPEPPWGAPLRYLAAMSTFAPVMALLGAKRPQDRGWQLIVASLCVILSLPAGEWLLFGGVAEIHPARFWFLVILIFVGATNHVGTRWWLPGLLYCGGQIALLLPYVSAAPPLAGRAAALAGLAALVASWSLVAAGWPRARAARAPLDRVWLDFRDAFGVVWGLRIAERMNASAAMYDWPVTLAWTGFASRTESDGGGASSTSAADPECPIPGPSPHPAIEESLRTLLRRFVSAEWIDARLNANANGPEHADPATASAR